MRGSSFLVFLVLLGLVGPLFLPDPFRQFDLEGLASVAPTVDHPFGTDQLSRDVLSRVVTGARISLAVAALAVGLSVTLGAGVGLVAGYWGGSVDAVLMRFVDGALAVPRLFLLLLVLAVPDRVPLVALILLIGTTGWFATSRLVRAEVLRLREESFVRAAEALGASRRRVIFRHLLVNAAGPAPGRGHARRRRRHPAGGRPLVSRAGRAAADALLGGMILDGRPALEAAPWISIFPGVAIVLTVLATNLVGDALRDAFDPRGA